jgi:hypothetical protein
LGLFYTHFGVGKWNPKNACNWAELLDATEKKNLRPGLAVVCRASSAPVQTRVKGVAQAVTQKIEGQHSKHNG